MRLQEEISSDIFRMARRQQIFPGLLHHLGDLDLHDLSVGAASVALCWWLQVSPPGARLNVITGVGKTRKPWADADLRAAVAEMLRRLKILVHCVCVFFFFFFFFFFFMGFRTFTNHQKQIL